MGDTTIEMVSHNEVSCSVKEIRVHYRALFSLCAVYYHLHQTKMIFFSQSKWEYLGFIQLIFSLLGTALAKRGALLRLLLRVIE